MNNVATPPANRNILFRRNEDLYDAFNIGDFATLHLDAIRIVDTERPTDSADIFKFGNDVELSSTNIRDWAVFDASVVPEPSGEDCLFWTQRFLSSLATLLIPGYSDGGCGILADENGPYALCERLSLR